MVDSTTTPTLTRAIQALIDANLLEVHTQLPAKILSYDYGRNLAIVQPLLKRKYKSDEFPVSLPTISNVPVAFPRMGDAFIRFPVNIGDEGKISFFERSIDKWLTIGGEVDPSDARKFSLSDAIFEIGLSSQLNRMVSIGAATSLQIQYKNSFIEIKENGKYKISNGVNELFDILVDLTTDLKTATDAMGIPFNATTIAKFEVLRVKLDTMKG